LNMDYHISYAKPLTSLVCAKRLNIESSPKFPMRMHQVAFRPKTNSYDAFSVEMMQDEILSLALFGTNGIEMIPPGIDDAMQSPNFKVPWLTMLHQVSKYCDELDINVSIWYPAFFPRYETTEEIATAESHWKLVFSELQRLDYLFVPGGDPGGRNAKELFAVLEKQTSFMREHFFPEAKTLVSSQYGLSFSVDLGLTEPWEPLQEEKLWFEELKSPKVQSFLDGVVYSPWSAIPIDEFRANVPACLPIRNYPDLCHVQTCEMPVHGWDLSFALTNNRESVNPRPREMARIIEDQSPFTMGCGCYSEGVNDDINKYTWTALHWGSDFKGPLENATPDRVLETMVRQYVCFLCDQPRVVNQMVGLVFCLEQNWQGDLLASKSILETHTLLRDVENSMVPRHASNWRLNMLRFRANHDVFLYSRLKQETSATNKAIDGLISDCQIATAVEHLQVQYMEQKLCDSLVDSSSLKSHLNVMQLSVHASIMHMYGQLVAMASVLQCQIGYQLSIGLGSQHRQRGGYFDLAWAPLGDAQYLHKMLELLTSDQPKSGKETLLLNRFNQSLDEMRGTGSYRTLWYASFGDSAANAIPGSTCAPTQPIPVNQVMPPYRALELGEDPVYFQRPLTEFLDISNDRVLKDLYGGLIPRAWRSYLVPIWPRTNNWELRFPFDQLSATTNQLSIRITYLGEDLNCHGGDWEELDRESMPVKLMCNGIQLHDFLGGQEFTRSFEYRLDSKSVLAAKESNLLTFTFLSKFTNKATFRYVPIPVAEFWILQDFVSQE